MGRDIFFRYSSHTFSLGQALGWIGTVVLLALLGAHFFRASAYGLLACCVGVFLLHCGHAQWKRYAVSFFLLWGAIEWGATAYTLAQIRIQAGLPWLRAACILWGVACVTGLGAVALYRQQRRTVGENAHTRLKGIVFTGSFCALYYLALAAPIPLLLLERFAPGWGEAQVLFISWYSVFALALLLSPKRSRKGRKLLWAVFSLVFFGQLALGLLGVEKMLMTGNLHIPVPGFIIFGPVFRGICSMMLVLMPMATLLGGSAWCSMLCYFGPLDSVVADNMPVKPIPPILQWMVRYGRPCVLAVGILVALALRVLEQPLEVALGISFLFVCASLCVMAIISKKYNSMMHCTAFCPVGIVVNTLGKISPWRIRIEQEKCDNCGVCEKICKYRAISSASRAKGTAALQCSLCMDCIPACKKQAINLRTAVLPLSGTTAKHVFLALLVIMHAVFIAFARV